MFWVFKLSFVVEILTFFDLKTVWATFWKIGQIFGHPGRSGGGKNSLVWSDKINWATEISFSQFKDQSHKTFSIGIAVFCIFIDYRGKHRKGVAIYNVIQVILPPKPWFHWTKMYFWTLQSGSNNKNLSIDLIFVMKILFVMTFSELRLYSHVRIIQRCAVPFGKKVVDHWQSTLPWFNVCGNIASGYLLYYKKRLLPE